MIKKAFLRLTEERQKEIMDIGMKLYVENKFEDVTIRLIVDALSINMATFYRYFEEKEDLCIYIYQNIYKRFIQNGIDVFRNQIPMDKLSETEAAFCEKVSSWPEEIYRKIIFEVHYKIAFPYVKASLRKERLEGNLRVNVVDDFVAYMYITAEYNFWCYCREAGITDEETIAQLGGYMDDSLFMEGIMNPVSSKEGEDNENGHQEQ